MPENVVREWAEWKGEMTATVRDLGLILRGHNDLFKERMDKQDKAIADVLHQALLTNSRVNNHEVVLTALKTVKEIEHEQVVIKHTYVRTKMVVGATLGGGILGVLVTHFAAVLGF